MIRFQLGRIMTTRGVEELTSAAQRTLWLTRHQAGDWGIMDAHDQRANDHAVRYAQRIHSAYALDPTKDCKGHGENCVWVITEWDRSRTTLLLPSEY